MRAFLITLISLSTGLTLSAQIAVTHHLSDSALLNLVERQTFEYFWEGAEPNSGMAAERVHLDNFYPQHDQSTVTTGGSGFGLMAILAAIDRHYITRAKGFARFRKIVGFLEKADRFHGAWPHWLDDKTGHVIPFGSDDDGGDLVETCYLLQGLLCVRQYFEQGNPAEKQLAARIDTLWRDVDFDWYRNGGQNVLFWHWSPSNGWKKNFPVHGYNECLILYVMAAASPTHPIPAEVYHEGWAQNGAINQLSYYKNDTLHLRMQGDPPHGGPLFWSQYSYLGLDPRGLKDRYADYWKENRTQSLINYNWCVDNPKNFKGYGKDNWGLTASYSVTGYAAHAPDEKNDLGVISPTAAISAIPYAPEQSMAAIRHWYEHLGDKLWGKYGFYDAFSEQADWHPPHYLAIDEGPIVPMIENYRSGLLWRLFMSCPEVQGGLKKLGFESPWIPFRQTTYCNPINIDYGYTPIPDFAAWGHHRATADPVIVNYKGDYYLFSTNQWGYWFSADMLDWHFVPRKFLRPWNQGYDELCAPAVGILGDTMIVFGSTYSRNFSIWMSTDPKGDHWKPLVDSFEIGGWDPAFFTDDDGRLYMYNGSSNSYPLYGIELDRKTFRPIGTRKELFLLQPDRYGWQRFGEYLDNTFLDPFVEGSWMTKHNGKYYLQYGAPGTEFSGYADGVAVGNSPLGPFDHPQSDPFSFHPGGFARGAGHGSTFQDNQGNYWHVSTVTIAVKNSFERRIGIWPAGFDKDGVLYMNAAFGDYPHYLPAVSAPTSGGFTGWMLLNYKKPVLVSSSLGAGHPANDAVDEDIKTYWSAATGNRGEWIQSDLGAISTVNAIQINYADQDAEFLGKQRNIFHQYKLYASVDGEKWAVIKDNSDNHTDIPHEYIELNDPLPARFIKLENIHLPTGKFAISGLRVFGKGSGALPETVKDFIVLRTEKDKRSAWIKWSPVDNAYAYNIYTGLAQDKLYNCIMVHDANEYYYKSMDKEKPYFFTIEAINENGVSPRTKVMKIN